MLYLSERPAKAAMPFIYPQNYYAYNEENKHDTIVRFVREIIENKKISKYVNILAGNGAAQRRVVDVGCGDGRLLDIFRKNVPFSWDMCGVEINTIAAENARVKGYDVISGDFEDNDVSCWYNSVDLVLLHQVIEHTRSPRSAIRKISRILKSGGLISIETPDTEGWDRRLFKARYWGGYHIPRHFHIFNKKNIRDLLEKEGYEIISCKSILSPVFWILSVHNYCMENKVLKRIAPFFNAYNPLCLIIVTMIELVETTIFRNSSNMQILARKI